MTINQNIYFMAITFNELRRIKDNLPAGSMRKIAERLNLDEETVRNYFGGANYRAGKAIGMHIEQGPDGGIVTFDDETILDLARGILAEKQKV
jgi:hypothetical protein